jgi:hypothetical protein
VRAQRQVQAQLVLGHRDELRLDPRLLGEVGEDVLGGALERQCRGLTACDDLGDAYLDTNRNGEHDNGLEPVWQTTNLDSSPLTSREAGNGIYNGILCRENDTACTRETVVVRREATLVLPSQNIYTVNGRPPGLPAAVILGMGDQPTFNFGLADINGNTLPPGTSLSVDTANAKNLNVRIKPENPAVRVNGEPNSATIIFTANDGEPGTNGENLPKGIIFVEIDTGGLITSYPISIN